MAELKNSDPELIHDMIEVVSSLLVRYGWYVLLVIVGVVFVWNRYISRMASTLTQRTEAPEVMASRAEQMEMARRRQQEIYDKQMQEFKEKEEQKQLEKKRQITELEKNVAKSVEPSTDLRKRNSKPFRDNSFNPLMGSTSGSTYRSSRSCGPSGGG